MLNGQTDPKIVVWVPCGETINDILSCTLPDGSVNSCLDCDTSLDSMLFTCT
jgi:hypothetical protein